MTFKTIIEKLQQDPRNATYTERGIPPIFQADVAAKILIIGQAPGQKVEESRIPFHDRSGEKLISWLGIDENVFYSPYIAIVPMDFYYPGKAKTGDKPPRAFIAREYHQEVIALMPDIELTILIGKYAMDHYLKGHTYKNLTETVQHYQTYLPLYFPIVHPSPLNFRWHKKNPWFEEEIVPHLQKHVHDILELSMDR